MSEIPPKSAYSLYLEELTELAKQQVEDKLKTKIQKRIYEKEGPLLLRDEYDETDVLFLVYAERRKAKDETSMRHLRKVAVELFMEAMSETTPDLTIINQLGHLAALYEFREDKPLTQHLSNEMLGFLSGRLRLPLEEIANLADVELALAVNALDMWITTNSFSTEPRWPEHTLKRIEELFLHTIETVGSLMNPVEEKLRLFLIVFRVVILLQPRWTGQVGLLKIIDEVNTLNTRSPIITRRWFRLCREYAARFRQNPEWAETFWGGVCELKQNGQLTDVDSFPLLVQDSLVRLGFEEKMREVWAPIKYEHIVQIKDLLRDRDREKVSA